MQTAFGYVVVSSNRFANAAGSGLVGPGDGSASPTDPAPTLLPSASGASASLGPVGPGLVGGAGCPPDPELDPVGVVGELAVPASRGEVPGGAIDPPEPAATAPAGADGSPAFAPVGPGAAQLSMNPSTTSTACAPPSAAPGARLLQGALRRIRMVQSYATLTPSTRSAQVTRRSRTERAFSTSKALHADPGPKRFGAASRSPHSHRYPRAQPRQQDGIRRHEPDLHRNALDDLHEVLRRVVRRQQ